LVSEFESFRVTIGSKNSSANEDITWEVKALPLQKGT